MESRRKYISQEMCWKTSALYITICCSENKTQMQENLETTLCLRKITTTRNACGWLHKPSTRPIYEWVNVDCSQPYLDSTSLASRAFLWGLEILRTRCHEYPKEHGGRPFGKIQPEKGVLGTCFPPAPGYFHKKELLLAHYVGKKIGKHIQNCAFLNKMIGRKV